jgi:hypothetical protein
MTCKLGPEEGGSSEKDNSGWGSNWFKSPESRQSKKNLMWLKSLMRTKMADIEIEVIQVEELGPDYRLLKN